MPFGFGRGRKKRGWGRGRGSKDFGQGGFPSHCICPHCSLIVPHQPGIPCFQTKYPQCGSPMARRFPVEEQIHFD